MHNCARRNAGRAMGRGGGVLHFLLRYPPARRSLTRPRLIPHDSVIAQHPDDD